jgi:hypothetical protein
MTLENRSLDKRPCQLGVYLNTPTQKHGEERVPAKVLGVKNLMLSKEELNALFDDAHAWDMLYVEHKGKPSTPFWHGKLGVLSHAVSKFANSAVNLSFGLKPYEVQFTGATIKTLKFEPTVGGLTSLSFTLVCLKSNVSGDLARLDEHLNGAADASVLFGDPEDDDEKDEDQEELDLKHETVNGTPVKHEKVDTKTRRRKPSVDATLN